MSLDEAAIVPVRDPVPAPVLAPESESEPVLDPVPAPEAESVPELNPLDPDPEYNPLFPVPVPVPAPAPESESVPVIDPVPAPEPITEENDMVRIT